jgi:hypothetical protein
LPIEDAPSNACAAITSNTGAIKRKRTSTSFNRGALRSWLGDADEGP